MTRDACLIVKLNDKIRAKFTKLTKITANNLFINGTNSLVHKKKKRKICILKSKYERYNEYHTIVTFIFGGYILTIETIVMSIENYLFGIFQVTQALVIAE